MQVTNITKHYIGCVRLMVEHPVELAPHPKTENMSNEKVRGILTVQLNN